MHKFSIIICTFNRPKSLGEAVKSIADQNYRTSHFEIIIVDNNPPNNRATIKKIIAQHPKVAISSLTESRQGISYATNLAISKCKYDKVILIDDDEIAQPDFCNFYDQLWQTHQAPTVGVIGGQILPQITSELVQKKFDWMMSSFASLNWIFGVLSLGYHEKVLQYPDALFSGNMSFDRRTILKVGGFDESLGVKRKNTYYYGHDVELCWRLQTQGFDVIYSPLPIVTNFISEDRFAFSHICNRVFLAGKEVAYIKHKLFKNNSIGKAFSDFMSSFHLRDQIKSIVLNSIYFFSYAKNSLKLYVFGKLE